MLIRRFSTTVIATAAVASIAAGPLASGATGAAGQHHHKSHDTHSASYARAYDTRLLTRTNHARSSHHASTVSMSHKLWKSAHAWAEHMARTGKLEHSPQVEARLSHDCPGWSMFGENVAYSVNRDNKRVFSAYMHSPEHRANILGKRFHEVGIASVKVVHGHDVEEWDVMDFANHC